MIDLAMQGPHSYWPQTRMTRLCAVTFHGRVSPRPAHGRDAGETRQTIEHDHQ